MSSPQITWDEPKIEWDGDHADHADALARTAKPTKFEQENSSVGRNFARGVGESIHHIGENLEHMNPLEAGMSMVGAGGQTDIQPPAPGKEFKWSDVHPSVRNVGRSLVDDIAPGKDLSEKGANAATLPLTGLMSGRDVPTQGRLPHYTPPEQVPFNLSRATARSAAGAGIDLLSSHPTPGRAAAAAGVGLATEVLPWAVTKAARSKPVVDFLTRKGGPRTPPPLESEVQAARDNTGPIHEIEDVPEGLRPKPAPPTGDPVSRAAGETKNLAADMEQASVAQPAAAPESVSATDGKPTPPVLPDVVNGKSLPISDTAKDAFQRFVKSKGKEGPLARQTKPAPSGERGYIGPRSERFAVPSTKPVSIDLGDGDTMNAHPLGGSRTSGEFPASVPLNKANIIMEKLTGKPGFENLRMVKSGKAVYSISWGKEVPSGASATEQGRAYGYSDNEINEYTGEGPFSKRRPDMQDDQAIKQEIEQLPEMKGPIKEAPSTSLPLITKGGKPQVFYHATTGDFKDFEGPTWLTDSKNLANDIANGFSLNNKPLGQNIRPVHLEGKMGKYESAEGDPFELAQSYEFHRGAYGKATPESEGFEGLPNLNDIIQKHQAKGETGIQTQGNSFDTSYGNEILVPNPKNIKQGAFPKGGPKEPGRKGKAELAEEFKRGRKKP